MKKTVNLKKAIIILILNLFFVSTTTFAQINLNGLKDKVKAKSKEVIQTEAEKKVSKSSTTTNKYNDQESNSGEKTNSDEEDNEAPKKYFSYTGTIPPNPKKDKFEREVGQILFSKAPINPGKENKQTITNLFTSGEEVFGLAYLVDSQKKLDFNRGYRIWIHDADDGSGFSASYEFESFDFKSEKVGTNNGDQKNYDLDIIATEKNAWDKNLTKKIIKSLALHLKNAEINNYSINRIHRFEVQIIANGFIVAKGDFYYDFSKDIEKFLKINEEYVKTDLKNFYLPASKRNDAVLAEKIKKTMINNRFNVQKVIFSTPEWGMIRHQISGAILQRSIWAYVVYKKDNGECYFDEIQFTEDYVGGKFNGIVKKAGYGTANGQILCENVK